MLTHLCALAPPLASGWAPRPGWSCRPTWPNSAPLGRQPALPQAPRAHALAPARSGVPANRQWGTGARRPMPGRPQSHRPSPHLPGLPRMPSRRMSSRRRQGERGVLVARQGGRGTQRHRRGEHRGGDFLHRPFAQAVTTGEIRKGGRQPGSTLWARISACVTWPQAEQVRAWPCYSVPSAASGGNSMVWKRVGSGSPGCARAGSAAWQCSQYRGTKACVLVTRSGGSSCFKWGGWPGCPPGLRADFFLTTALAAPGDSPMVAARNSCFGVQARFQCRQALLQAGNA